MTRWGGVGVGGGRGGGVGGGRGGRRRRRGGGRGRGGRCRRAGGGGGGRRGRGGGRHRGARVVLARSRPDVRPALLVTFLRRALLALDLVLVLSVVRSQPAGVPRRSVLGRARAGAGPGAVPGVCLHERDRCRPAHLA